MNANEFNRRQAAAERDLKVAIANAQHAIEWLTLDKPEGKPTGTVPWRYDLNEAIPLLHRATANVHRALENAVDPDTARFDEPTGDFGREVDLPTAAEVMEQEG